MPALVCGAVAAIGFFLLPPVANHLRYALPYAMPSRISYRDRDYIGDGACVAARQTLGAQGGGLASVGEVWTLFGRPHSIVTDRSAVGSPYVPTVIFIQRGNCYLPYSLSGGP
jgi:hypothetical protein